MTRRSLMQGLKTPDGVSPDAAQAFIKQDPQPDVPRNTPVLFTQDQNTQDIASSNVKPPKRKKSKLTITALVPVTVRLDPEIAGALKRASLERQLDGEETYTQQDLVTMTLQPWLIAQGYLDADPN